MFEGLFAPLIKDLFVTIAKIATKFVTKFFGVIAVLLISSLLLAFFLQGLSPSSSLAWVAQRIGYSDTRWLIVASSSIRGAVHGGLVTAVSLAAAFLTSFVGFRPKAAPFAGVLFLLAVEAAGTRGALLTAVFVVVGISLFGVCDAFRNRPAGGYTWPYVVKDTLVQIFLIICAAPIFLYALLAGSVKILSDGWLRPEWSEGAGSID